MANHKEQFKNRLNLIETLIEVPSSIRDFSLEGLRTLDSSDLTNTGQKKIENLIKAISNLEDSSIKKHFQEIYNQVCILAVSALAVTLENYFINYATTNWQLLNPKELEKTKITLSELLEFHDFNLKPTIGLIIKEKDTQINFQDLQSTKRAFESYFQKSIIISEDIEKYIIFFQQCRHILVHKDGKVDDFFVKRVEQRKANLKNFKKGDQIKLSVKDWDIIKKSFSSFVDSIIPEHKEDL